MIEIWTAQRSVRVFLAISVLAAGFALAVLLIRQEEFVLAIAIFTIGLAALVGVGKQATP